MSMSGSAVELPITTEARGAEAPLSARELKKQMRLQEAKTKLSSPWASGIAIILAILWTIPTFGLFVTSFRPPEDIKTSGWWTFFANPGITFENYTNAWSNSAGGLSEFFLNSFVIVFPAVLIPTFAVPLSIVLHIASLKKLVMESRLPIPTPVTG